MTPPRIAFLLPSYSRHSTSYMPEIVQALADQGAVVEVIVPTSGPIDLGTVHIGHDLYVLRKMSGLALSLAGALDGLGATIVNSYPITAALRDKIVASRLLQAAGVPTPATFVADEVDDLVPLLEDGPLVVKPYAGAGGHHVQVVRSPAELAAVPRRSREPVFAQRYLPHDGWDRKIYAIGDRLFGVKKVFPRRTAAEKLGEPFVLSAELEDIAKRCARAFGGTAELYGIDIVESGGQPYVVDMGTAPGYKGVPDAPRLVADYLCTAASALEAVHA